MSSFSLRLVVDWLVLDGVLLDEDGAALGI